jgi:hypothetical protein
VTRTVCLSIVNFGGFSEVVGYGLCISTAILLNLEIGRLARWSNHRWRSSRPPQCRWFILPEILSFRMRDLSGAFKAPRRFSENRWKCPSFPELPPLEFSFLNRRDLVAGNPLDRTTTAFRRNALLNPDHAPRVEGLTLEDSSLNNSALRTAGNPAGLRQRTCRAFTTL